MGVMPNPSRLDFHFALLRYGFMTPMHQFSLTRALHFYKHTPLPCPRSDKLMAKKFFIFIQGPSKCEYPNAMDALIDYTSSRHTDSQVATLLVWHCVCIGAQPSQCIFNFGKVPKVSFLGGMFRATPDIYIRPPTLRLVGLPLFLSLPS